MHLTPMSWTSNSHLLTCMQVSKDGQRLCTTSADKTVKFYDVVSFDMSHMIKLTFTPTRAAWIHERGRKVLYSRLSASFDECRLLYNSSIQIREVLRSEEFIGTEDGVSAFNT